MAGDNIHNAEYSCDTFSDQRLLGRKQEFVRNVQASTSSSYLEMIDGVWYRKKSEKGNTNYREILDEGTRLRAIATFHLKGKTHRTLEETYRLVAENYWWEGMYFHIREYVLGCQKCHAQRRGQDGPGPLVSRTVASHGNSVLRELRSQREAGLFCDVILKTDSRSLPAHRAVLAAVSEYFQEIFTETGCALGLQAHVDLSGFCEEFFLPLLEFCYSSTLSVQAGLLGEVCALAQHLRMWSAVEACVALQSEQEMGLGRREYDAPAAGLLRKRKCVKSSFALKDEPFGNAQKRVSSRQRVPATNNHLSDCLRSSRSQLGAKGTSSGRRLMLLDFKSPSGKSEFPTSLSGSSPPAEGTFRRPARFLRSNTSPQEPQSRTVDSEISPASSCGTQRPQLGQAQGSGESLGLEETVEDEAESSRSLEKYRLLSVLGLQRKTQFPDPVQPAGWQQKQRLRKLKVLSYALTTPRGLRPASPGTTSLPVKVEPPEPIAVEEAGNRRGCLTNRARPLRHKEVLRRSVRIRDAPLQNLPRLRARKAEPRARAPRKRPVRVKREPAHPAVSPYALPDCSTPGHQQGEPSFNRRGRGPPDPLLVQGGSHARLVGSTVRECTRKARVNDGAPWWSKSIKDEPADLFPVSVAPELGKRQSKPPVKLLDPGFLFEFCRPVGVKRESEGGDKRMSQSVERLKQRGRASRLRCEGMGVASQGLHRARSGTAKVDRCLPKKRKQRPLLENTRTVRKKGPAPMTSHTCVLCQAKYRSCDAVIMHQIRHTEGKHWPCPLCSKTFFRQRNVQSHIRTHDPNLYKCRSCISAT